MKRRKTDRQNENVRLRKALEDCVHAQYCSDFPKRQCAANRGRILLEKLSKIDRSKTRRKRSVAVVYDEFARVSEGKIYKAAARLTRKKGF